MLAQDLEYSILKKYRSVKVAVGKVSQRYPLKKMPWRRITACLVLAVLILSSSPVSSSSLDTTPANKQSRFGHPDVGASDSVTAPPAPGADHGLVKGASTFRSLAEASLLMKPERIPDSPDLPSLSAKAVLFVDSKSGVPLYEKNTQLQLPPASLTKMMTALVTVEQYPLEEEVSVPLECLSLPDSQKMGLTAGEVLDVKDLLTGLLVFSASDAACTLSLHKTTTGEFVARMNAKAESLGMKQTKFANPIGLDEAAGNLHYSTATDLLFLTDFFLKNDFLRKIISTPQITISSPDGKFTHKLTSTNELLGSYPGIEGIKTGYTQKAGGCFISLFSRGGHEIVGIILGSDDRFGETKVVLDWIYSVYRWP